MIALGLLLSASCLAQSPVLGIQDTQFTLDGQPAFLLGISYYGALSAEDEQTYNRDLIAMRACGFNWMRVWATWDMFDENVSAVAPDGSARQPYMRRLQRLCELAGTLSMVVDVTVTRGKEPNMPASLPQLESVWRTLAKELKSYRNVYFDVGNERNIGDARHESMEQVGHIIQLVKRLDPERLCTASHAGDLSEEEIRAYVQVGKVDFIAPHRPRHAESPGETADRTRQYLAQLNELRRMPVHYQEPFRRGYGWEPSRDDFITDLKQARSGGAAGWCFHNGSIRGVGASADGRPRRSFDLRASEGPLFGRLDETEQAFLEWLRGQAARTNPERNP